MKIELGVLLSALNIDLPLSSVSISKEEYMSVASKEGAERWKKRLYQPLRDTGIDTIQENWLVQMKYDGWWCGLILADDLAYFLTKGGIRKIVKLKSSGYFGAFVGEWMFGTNWSQSNFKDQIAIHDCYSWNEYDFTDIQYDHRRDLVALITSNEELKESLKAFEVPVFHHYDAKRLWNLCREGFDGHTYEGLVFKPRQQLWGKRMYRTKLNFSKDYVVMAVIEGSGRLFESAGALQCGLYKNGILVPICSVGGGLTDDHRKEIWQNRDQYIGKVLEVQGKAEFPSNALRHPNFYRWRDDKQPEDCVFVEHE